MEDLWSGAGSCEAAPPLFHRAFGLVLFLLRLVFRAGFCGVVSVGRAWGWGSESCDEDDVRSEADSKVEEPELARTTALAYAGAVCSDTKAVRREGVEPGVKVVVVVVVDVGASLSGNVGDGRATASSR